MFVVTSIGSVAVAFNPVPGPVSVTCVVVVVVAGVVVVTSEVVVMVAAVVVVTSELVVVVAGVVVPVVDSVSERGTRPSTWSSVDPRVVSVFGSTRDGASGIVGSVVGGWGTETEEPWIVPPPTTSVLAEAITMNEIIAATRAMKVLTAVPASH